MNKKFKIISIVGISAISISLMGIIYNVFALENSPMIVNDVPILTTKPNPSENLINLNWSMADIKNKTFKVYQRKPGNNEFQTISTTNFDENKQVKVLNVYPPNGVVETYTTWKGETVTLPISASLKKWMEVSNSEDSKGYGKGIIAVDSVTFDNFNLNPNTYLKNTDGTWKYDVIMFGTMDSNGGKDLTVASLESTKEFIDNGKGVLFGHDTVTQWGGKVNFSKLENYINVKTYGFKGSSSGTTPDKIWNMPWSGGKEISVTKKGLLTNFPWSVGDIGTVLTVPYTHTNSQIAKGDIWMKFSNPTPDDNSTVPIDKNEYSDNGVGTNMMYLTTWNNTAMIQTGHAIGRYNATPDEQKLLANTLFYLNQLSTDNFLDDNSGQDVDAPNKPSVNKYIFDKNNVKITLNSTSDNGSTYEYYVESNSKDGITTTSNKVSATITSGFKGYSYIVDTSPNSEPDNVIETTSNDIPINMDNKIVYLHIKAIDNVNNPSDTLHYKIEDNTLPNLSISGNTTEWTREDITLIVTASDSQTGIKQIMLPNGNAINGLSATFIANNNGNYIFKAIDNVGNETSKTEVVSKIDRTPPILTYTKEISSNKLNGFININANDLGSGVDYIILPDNNKILTSTFKYEVTNNGYYTFVAYDKVGNHSVNSVLVNELEISNVPSGISKIEYKLEGATVKSWTTYTTPFEITNEGVTTITARAYDKFGNISYEKVSYARIDKTNPTNNSVIINLN